MQIMTTWKKEKTMDIREDEIIIKRERFEALVMTEQRCKMLMRQVDVLTGGKKGMLEKAMNHGDK